MRSARPRLGFGTRRIRILASVGAALLVTVGTGVLTGFHVPPHPVVQSDPTATGSEVTTSEIIGIRTFTAPPGITVTADVVYDILADGTMLTLDVCSPADADTSADEDAATQDATVAGDDAAAGDSARVGDSASPGAAGTDDTAAGAESPRADVSLATPPTRPGVLSIHGGSWARGDKASSDWRGVCLWLASAGFVAYSVNYRLAPDALFPAAIDDVSRAVEWIREPANATAHGVDPDRIGVFGGSAGGNLAALLGARGSGSWTTGSRVASVAVLSAPFDLRETAVANGEATRRDVWTTANAAEGTADGPAAGLVTPPTAPGSTPALTGDLRRITLRYLGCSTLAECEPARSASATSAVDADDPPVFIGTAADEFMPLTQATEYAARLEKVGIPHTLVEVPGAAHSIGLLDETMRAAVAAFLHSTLGR
ncbi:hypothetical protein GCM10022381_31000 [Leifsonia kafniensis]|uniref:Alpha/beta hydrolase fold-3 domain-containing protein n=1 Tax=Leifsonia kafniensis TaxID=475957 RepID=A0ABP7KTD8_9MICO